MKSLLIVDDNDRYAALIREHYEPLGYSCDRVGTAAEGIQRVKDAGLSHYSVIVTDITMESQMAGFKLIRYLKKEQFPGTLVVASTGFDVKPGMILARMIMGNMGVDFLIPKSTVLKKAFQFFEPRLYGEQVSFREKWKAPAQGVGHH